MINSTHILKQRGFILKKSGSVTSDLDLLWKQATHSAGIITVISQNELYKNKILFSYLNQLTATNLAVKNLSITMQGKKCIGSSIYVQL